MRRIIRILIICSLVLGLSSNLALAGPGLQGTAPGVSPSVFLPILNGGAGFQLKGRVVGLNDEGLASVPVTDNQGRTAITDSNGYYTFSGLSSDTYAVAPRQDGYSFYPSMASGKLPSQNQVPVFKAVAACASAIVNTSFEMTQTNGTEPGWDLPITVYPAAYTTSAYHTGTTSVRTGIVKPADNIYSYSSVRSQVISIPADTTNITLRFWLYPTSTEPLSKALPAQPVTDKLDSAPLASDVQYVMVLKPGATLADDTRWETVYWSRSNDQFWSFHEFNLDVTKYAGKNIKIQLGTFNDGYDGITGMYVDDVTLDVCNSGTTPPPVVTPTPGPTATPVATGTPAPTPLPGTCNERVANNSFETVSNWDIPATRFSAGYSTDLAHTGVQSMRTGITVDTFNRFSYSDARQFVSIPSGSTSATLSLWAYQLTEETPAIYMPTPVAHGPFSVQSGANDIQYVLILDQWQNWIGTLLWQRQNTAAWTNYTFDLSNYIGKSIYIQFGTYNDGLDGITSMYMDDVSLQACP
jgi:hypothetical protein